MDRRPLRPAEKRSPRKDRESTLVPQTRNSYRVSLGLVRMGCVAPRLHTPGMRPRRALPMRTIHGAIPGTNFGSEVLVPWTGRRSARGGGHRDGEEELASSPLLALYPQVPAVGPHDPPGDEQPQPRP